MPVHSTHIVRIVDEDDVVEVLQTVKRAIRRARLVLAAFTVRDGPVRDVQSLLRQCRSLLLDCDLGRVPVADRERMLSTLDNLLSEAGAHFAQDDEIVVAPAVYSGGSRGRPRVVIDIQRVVALRDMGNLWSDIARTVGCSRQTLWNRLKDMDAGEGPAQRQMVVSDEALDEQIRQIKSGHAFIGSGIVRGHLEALDIRVSLKRVKTSLARVDPLGSARRRHRSIRRRVYRVRGSNFLWHMDQNEKLQPWGFMLHGCVDGHSRLHLWAECRLNKRAGTVLRIAFAAFGIYGVPHRIRADRGTENNGVEEFMMAYRGASQSPFLRGRSVQNVRIERLWGDVRKDSTEQFRVLFTSMESNRVLKMEHRSHRVCLVLTYMARIQAVLDRSRQAWNHHQVRTARNQTPLAMYELSRDELIRAGRWSGDGTRPEADVGAGRQELEGEARWAKDVLHDVDFDEEDGMDGVRVFLDAVVKLRQRVPNVDDENVVFA